VTPKSDESDESDVLANILLYVYRYVTRRACESVGKNVTFVTFVTEKGGFPTSGQYPGYLEAPMTKPIENGKAALRWRGLRTVVLEL
jgi:hypothetical protein